jgi:hypothetical protein
MYVSDKYNLITVMYILYNVTHFKMTICLSGMCAKLFIVHCIKTVTDGKICGLKSNCVYV